MSYSIWSRGRLLGTTDLAWLPCRPRHRAGDLRPANHPDLLIAADRRAPLDLELRGPDGEVIPTERVVVLDTERLLARAAEAPREAWDDGETNVDASLAEPIEFDPTRAYEDDGLPAFEAEIFAEPEALAPRELARWQVLVALHDDAAVP